MLERAAQQTDAADEAGASDAASPLICMLGGFEMIRSVITSFATAGLLVAASPAVYPAAGKQCTREDATMAEDSVSVLRKWADVYKSFKRFGHCDDGGIAEGYSDAIVRLLARRWPTLSELQPLVSAHRNFHDFVLRHIDATADPRDLDKIISKAATSCPVKAQPLCGEIEKQAREALREAGVSK